MAQNKRGNREELIKERQGLIKELPGWKDILRGSVLTYFLPCGKKGCRCKSDKDSLHGPYYYISVSEKGKTRMYLLGRKRKEAVYAVARYNDMIKKLYRICGINLRLLLARKEEDERKEKD
ncbi:MAG: hypothetical protein HZA00_13310 [Nitrospinae bacterium]|nr:hypothetical protein [Nitrospinota bacterium]